MMFTGMIFQYDNTLDSGLIILSDGEKKEFSIMDWIDTMHKPTIGQKISYESNNNKIEMRVATPEDEQKALMDKEKKMKEEKKLKESIEACESVDDYVSYFTKMGFKLVKDETSDATRIVTLRFYSMDQFAEAMIREHDS
ncbi:hypothetical protein JHD48_05775, partial [Sulfurimonas sp. SAG-AH-194-I05]